MKMKRFGIGTLLMAALVAGATAQTTLDPAFRVINVNGDCQIGLPGEDVFAPAQESKAYPYGSSIRTGSRSSLVLVITDGNVVRVLANADLVFKQDESNPKIKSVRLNDGEVEVELKKNFNEGGNSLNVETATAICGAVGTHFRVASRMEQDLRIIIFRVIEGIIRVYGENFEVAALDANDWLSLLSPPDRSFLRHKNMKGAFDIRIKDENMNDKNMPTQEGTVLKVWQRLVPETNQRIITAVLTSPDGEMIETVTVTYGPGQRPQFAGAEGAPWTEPGNEGNGDGEDPQHPLPPEDVMDRFIDRVINEENVEYRPQPLPVPRPPTPTPVGRR